MEEKNTPLLLPLAEQDMDQSQRRLIAPFVEQGRDFAVFRTMLHHPVAMEAFLTWGSYILSDANTLPPKQRELAILRTGARRNCEYEFLRHAVIARRLGLTDDQLRAVAKESPDMFDDDDASVLRAADELLIDDRLTPPTFESVRSRFGEKSAIDLIWTVGQYAQVCMFLNTIGVAPDPDIADDSLRGLVA